MRVNVPAILLLLALAAHHSSAQGPPGEAEGDLTTTLETVEVAEGVLAFVAAVPRSQIVNGNSVAVLGRDAVLVVDAGLVPSLARRIVAEVRRRTDLPIRFLVNTHWHWDHNLGNFVFREEQPGVAIVSTPFTRDSISAFNSRQLGGYLERGEQAVQRMRDQLDQGIGPDGKELSAVARETQSVLVDDLASVVADMKRHTARVVVPDLTTDGDLSIDLGGRLVQVMTPGRANTAGDAVVWVPDVKVLVTGDLVVYPTPYATSAYPREWAATLRTLLDDLRPSAIVPGHGPVFRDEAYARSVVALLDSVAGQVEASAARGLTAEQALEEVDVAAFQRQMAGDVPRWNDAFRELFLAPAVRSVWKLVHGQSIDESPFQ